MSDEIDESDKRRDLAEANKHLLQAAMYMSPTGKTQQAFSTLSNTSASEIDRAARLLSAMLDGVAYGNWMS